MAATPTRTAPLSCDEAFVDYYRCPAEVAALGKQQRLSSESGYFQFGGAIGFGRIAGGRPAAYSTDPLVDVESLVGVSRYGPVLPFDLSEVVTNLREERYRRNGYGFLEKSTSGDVVQRLYYSFRPYLPVGVRKHLQKVRLSGWQKISFPSWPVDFSVERLMENTMAALLKAHGRTARMPFVWFWPEGASGCAMLTHDVEGQSGLDFCDRLMDLDDDFGFKSTFQLIPEGREDAWRGTASRLRARGFEVNLHDLNHDGLLFSSRDEFLRRAARINQYAREFQCDGFRSGAMYREQSWFQAFEFAYDLSVPNVAHLEPQRGGCCTVMPYFVGNVLELPLTLTQDYTLFHMLNDYSTRLWREQIRLILARHGFISVITHPDYLVGERERAVYKELLTHVAELRDRQGVWVALPGEINRWWRSRREMTLVETADGWRIQGPDSHRARLAYASMDGDRVQFSVEDHGPDRSPARSAY